MLLTVSKVVSEFSQLRTAKVNKIKQCLVFYTEIGLGCKRVLIFD